MSLRLLTKRQLKLSFVSLVLYRVPLDVVEICVFPNGHRYPVCPRCKTTLEWEYMTFCDRCGQRLGWEHYDSAEVVYISPSCQ